MAQALIGTEPWGSNTNSPQFPIQRGDVDQFNFDLDIDETVSGSEWNLAEEWWLTSEKPGTDVSNTIEHEVMLVLDWGSDLTQGGVIESDAVTDKYGNSIDYWSNYQISWNFQIFCIAAQQVPDAVDLSAIIAYMSENIESVSPDLWITGVELGNEYWDDTSGSTRINQFDVTVNGETATSGPTDG